MSEIAEMTEPDLMASPSRFLNRELSWLKFNERVLEEADTTGPRRGCFLCNASIDEAQLDTGAKDFINDAMRRIERKFQDTLAGDAPYDQDTKLRKATATKLLSFYFGLRVLIKARMPASGLKAGVREAIEDI